MLEGELTMATEPQSVKVHGDVSVKGIPHLWQLALAITMASVAIVGSLAGLGKWYVDKTVEVLNAAADTREAKGDSHQLQFKMVLKSIVENSKEMTEEQKKLYSGLLSEVKYEDVKDLLASIPFNKDRRSLNALLREKQVEQTEKVTGLSWNNGSPAQIRFIARKDPSLNFQNIDLYSDPPDACSSKVIQLGSTSSATVQVCESHLDRKLEMIVIRNTE
jgi:predicted HicB family RNase H-like nuclease